MSKLQINWRSKLLSYGTPFVRVLLLLNLVALAVVLVSSEWVLSETTSTFLVKFVLTPLNVLWGLTVLVLSRLVSSLQEAPQKTWSSSGSSADGGNMNAAQLLDLASEEDDVDAVSDGAQTPTEYLMEELMYIAVSLCSAAPQDCRGLLEHCSKEERLAVHSLGHLVRSHLFPDDGPTPTALITPGGEFVSEHTASKRVSVIADAVELFLFGGQSIPQEAIADGGAETRGESARGIGNHNYAPEEVAELPRQNAEIPKYCSEDSHHSHRSEISASSFTDFNNRGASFRVAPENMHVNLMPATSSVKSKKNKFGSNESADTQQVHALVRAMAHGPVEEVGGVAWGKDGSAARCERMEAERRGSLVLSRRYQDNSDDRNRNSRAKPAPPIEEQKEIERSRHPSDSATGSHSLSEFARGEQAEKSRSFNVSEAASKFDFEELRTACQQAVFPSHEHSSGDGAPRRPSQGHEHSSGDGSSGNTPNRRQERANSDEQRSRITTDSDDHVFTRTSSRTPGGDTSEDYAPPRPTGGVTEFVHRHRTSSLLVPGSSMRGMAGHSAPDRHVSMASPASQATFESSSSPARRSPRASPRVSVCGGHTSEGNFDLRRSRQNSAPAIYRKSSMASSAASTYVPAPKTSVSMPVGAQLETIDSLEADKIEEQGGTRGRRDSLCSLYTMQDPMQDAPPIEPAQHSSEGNGSNGNKQKSIKSKTRKLSTQVTDSINYSIWSNEKRKGAFARLQKWGLPPHVKQMFSKYSMRLKEESDMRNTQMLGARSADDLAAEIEAGTSRIDNDNGKAIRVVQVTAVRIVAPGSASDGKKDLILVQKWHRDCEGMWFRRNDLPGTKQDSEEEPWDAAQRLLSTIFGDYWHVVQVQTDAPLETLQVERESPSFPGVMTRYVTTIVEVQVVPNADSKALAAIGLGYKCPANMRHSFKTEHKDVGQRTYDWESRRQCRFDRVHIMGTIDKSTLDVLEENQDEDEDEEDDDEDENDEEVADEDDDQDMEECQADSEMQPHMSLHQQISSESSGSRSEAAPTTMDSLGDSASSVSGPSTNGQEPTLRALGALGVLRGGSLLEIMSLLSKLHDPNEAASKLQNHRADFQELRRSSITSNMSDDKESLATAVLWQMAMREFPENPPANKLLSPGARSPSNSGSGRVSLNASGHGLRDVTDGLRSLVNDAAQAEEAQSAGSDGQAVAAAAEAGEEKASGSNSRQQLAGNIMSGSTGASSSNGSSERQGSTEVGGVFLESSRGEDGRKTAELKRQNAEQTKKRKEQLEKQEKVPDRRTDEAGEEANGGNSRNDVMSPGAHSVASSGNGASGALQEDQFLALSAAERAQRYAARKARKKKDQESGKSETVGYGALIRNCHEQFLKPELEHVVIAVDGTQPEHEVVPSTPQYDASCSSQHVATPSVQGSQDHDKDRSSGDVTAGEEELLPRRDSSFQDEGVYKSDSSAHDISEVRTTSLSNLDGIEGAQDMLAMLIGGKPPSPSPSNASTPPPGKEGKEGRDAAPSAKQDGKEGKERQESHAAPEKIDEQQKRWKARKAARKNKATSNSSTTSSGFGSRPTYGELLRKQVFSPSPSSHRSSTKSTGSQQSPQPPPEEEEEREAMGGRTGMYNRSHSWSNVDGERDFKFSAGQVPLRISNRGRRPSLPCLPFPEEEEDADLKDAQEETSTIPET